MALIRPSGIKRMGQESLLELKNMVDMEVRRRHIEHLKTARCRCTECVRGILCTRCHQLAEYGIATK